MPQLVQSLRLQAGAAHRGAASELCRTRPAGLEAVLALGDSLLLNNLDREEFEVVLGAPGAGKTAQCRLRSEQ
jgi:hypothetical protein